MSLFSTPTSEKKRIASEPMLTVGGVSRIMQGIFGLGSPAAGLASQNVGQDAQKSGGPFHLFEADIFTPGTGNWVVDPTADGPLYTVWGHGFLRLANGFNPIQQPQVFSAASSKLFGVGGQIAGQIITQPLSEPQETGADQ